MSDYLGKRRLSAANPSAYLQKFPAPQQPNYFRAASGSLESNKAPELTNRSDGDKRFVPAPPGSRCTSHGDRFWSDSRQLPAVQCPKATCAATFVAYTLSNWLQL